MPETFGARMREQRERQQVALSTIAEQTKIKVSLLEALERDDVSHWPSGIFRRAFIRAYAHAIGLEPDAIVREFLDLHPEPPQVFADVSNGHGEDGRATDGAHTRFKYLVASAIGSVSRLRTRANQKQEPTLDFTTPIVESAIQEDPVPVRTEVTEDEEPTVKMMAPVMPVKATAAPEVAFENEPVAPPSPESAAQVDVCPPAKVAHDPDLLSIAHLCTEFACVQTISDIPPLLDEMTRLLDAVGVILWMWDPIANELRPALAHGYSERVVAQLPRVDRDTNNATAAAFRAARTCIVKRDELGNGALAVPLMSPAGCIGVLAIELAEERENRESVRAHAMILAAQLAALLGTAQPIEAADRRLA